MRVYVSGMISGLPLEELKEKFQKAEEYLQGLGHVVVNPLNNGLDFEAPWSSHILLDIYLLNHCDAIYMLDNWLLSRGAVIEKIFAESAGKTVLFENKIETEKQEAQEQQFAILQIEGAIQEVTGLNLKEIRKESREQMSFFARMIFAFNCRKRRFKHDRIAEILNRDNTTVRHYLRKYDDEFKYNQEFREIAEKVNEILIKITQNI